MLEEYLAGLEKELARRLPEYDVQARLAEAEAHLQEGVAARLELGLEEDEAEREAIRAFGTPRQIAEASVNPAKPRLAPRLRWLGSGYGLGIVFFVFAWRLGDLYPASIVGLFATWSLIGLAFAFCSFRARRPALIPVALTGALGAVAVWLTIGTSWIDLRPYGSNGVLPPGGAESMMRETNRALAESRADWATLEAGMRKIKGPQGIETMRTSGGYRTPVLGSNWGWNDRLAFKTVADPAVALAAWQDVHGTARIKLETIGAEAQVAAIPEALADASYKNLIHMAPQILPPCLGVAAFAVLVDIVCGNLGAGVFAYRRRRNRGLRA